MKAATVNTEVRNFFFGFSGFFDRREFIVTQHPLERTVCDFWRMIWEQDSRLIVTLSSIDSQECRPFWPAIIGETLSLETNKRDQQMRLTLLEEVDTLARRAIRLNLELVSIGLSFHLGPLGKYVHIVVFYGPTASTYSLSLWNSICLFCLLHLCLYLMSSIYIQRESTLLPLKSSLSYFGIAQKKKRKNLFRPPSGLLHSVFSILCFVWIEKFFLVTLLTKFLCSRSPPPIQLPWGIRAKFGFSSVPIGLNSAHHFLQFLTSSKWQMKNIRLLVEDLLSLWTGKIHDQNFCKKIENSNGIYKSHGK